MFKRSFYFLRIAIILVLLLFICPTGYANSGNAANSYECFNRKGSNNNDSVLVLTKDILKSMSLGKAEKYKDSYIRILDSFDLKDETIVIPENCVLSFEGGQLRNGIIEGHNTTIRAGIENIFGDKTELNGSWVITEVYPEWFGAKYNGADCTAAFAAVYKTCRNTNIKKIVLSEQIYYTQTIVLSNRFYLTGSSKSRNATVVQYGNHPDQPLIKTDGEGGGHITIENITIKSSGIRTAYTVNLTNVHSTTIENCSFEKDNKLNLPTPIDKNGIYIGRENRYTGHIYMTRFLKNRLNQCCVKIEGTDGYIAFNEIWGIDCQYGLCLENSGNHMINSNQIIGGKEGCIYITGYCTALKIYGNYFDGSSGANAVSVPYGIHSEVGTFTNNIISNNNFWHISGPAISLKSSNSDVILGNVFDDCDWNNGKTPDIEIQTVKNTSISSNVFVRTDSHGRTDKDISSPIIVGSYDKDQPPLINGNTMNGTNYYTYSIYPLVKGQSKSTVKATNNSSDLFGAAPVSK